MHRIRGVVALFGWAFVVAQMLSLAFALDLRSSVAAQSEKDGPVARRDGSLAKKDRHHCLEGGLSPPIRFVPAQKDRRPIGWKLFALCPFHEAVGLRSGDLVERIDGVDASRPDGLREALLRLDGNGPHALTIERRGRPRILDVFVRD